MSAIALERPRARAVAVRDGIVVFDALFDHARPGTWAHA